MKNQRIERTLFWFKDKNDDLLFLNGHFFGLALLYNRLLNEVYVGRRIQFINIDFASEEKYKLFPQIPENYIHYYGRSGGHLRYYGLLNFSEFYGLSEENQCVLIWEKAYNYLKVAAQEIKNNSLSEACEYAYKRGLEKKLNTDYRIIETDIIFHNQLIKAAIWVNFKGDNMFSKLTLERNDTLIFEKNIDQTKSGNEFFLEMYKSIEVNGNNIIVKGHRDAGYFPLKIPIDANQMPLS